MKIFYYDTIEWEVQISFTHNYLTNYNFPKIFYGRDLPVPGHFFSDCGSRRATYSFAASISHDWTGPSQLVCSRYSDLSRNINAFPAMQLFPLDAHISRNWSVKPQYRYNRATTRLQVRQGCQWQTVLFPFYNRRWLGEEVRVLVSVHTQCNSKQQKTELGAVNGASPSFYAKEPPFCQLPFSHVASPVTPPATTTEVPKGSGTYLRAREENEGACHTRQPSTDL